MIFAFFVHDVADGSNSAHSITIGVKHSFLVPIPSATSPTKLLCKQIMRCLVFLLALVVFVHCYRNYPDYDYDDYHDNRPYSRRYHRDDRRTLDYGNTAMQAGLYLASLMAKPVAQQVIDSRYNPDPKYEPNDIEKVAVLLTEMGYDNHKVGKTYDWPGSIGAYRLYSSENGMQAWGRHPKNPNTNLPKNVYVFVGNYQLTNKILNAVATQELVRYSVSGDGWSSECGWVGERAKNSFNRIITQSLRDVLQLAADGGSSILFTGHGEGASIATLLMLQQSSRFTKFVQNFKLITFGAPKMGDKNFKKCFDEAVAPGSSVRFITEYYTPKGEKADDKMTLIPNYYPVGEVKKVPCFDPHQPENCHTMSAYFKGTGFMKV
jgi:hypothetical protein